MLEMGCAIRFDWAMLLFIRWNPERYYTPSGLFVDGISAMELYLMNDLLSIAIEEMALDYVSYAS